MVATQDIGRLAADLIREEWTGKRVVELEGPARVSPSDLAEAFLDACAWCDPTGQCPNPFGGCLRS